MEVEPWVLVATSATAGAIINQVANSMAAHFEHRRQRSRDQEARRRQLYQDLLISLQGFPDDFTERFIEDGDTFTFAREFRRSLDRYRAALALEASDEVRGAADAALQSIPYFAKAMERLHDDRVEGGWDAVLQRAWDDSMAQAYRQLAAAMRREVG